MPDRLVRMLSLFHTKVKSCVRILKLVLQDQEDHSNLLFQNRKLVSTES